MFPSCMRCGCLFISVRVVFDGITDCGWWGIGKYLDLSNQCQIHFYGAHILGQPVQGSNLLSIQVLLVPPRVKFLDHYQVDQRC